LLIRHDVTSWQTKDGDTEHSLCLPSYRHRSTSRTDEHSRPSPPDVEHEDEETEQPDEDAEQKSTPVPLLLLLEHVCPSENKKIIVNPMIVFVVI
jgi:hypothetical protein